MSLSKTAALVAIVGATSIGAVQACDYSLRSDVTADATAAEPAPAQQPTVAATDAPTADTAAPQAPAQTAEAAPVAADQPKAN